MSTPNYELIASFEDILRVSLWLLDRNDSSYDRYFAYSDIITIVSNSGIDTNFTKEVIECCKKKMYD